MLEHYGREKLIETWVPADSRKAISEALQYQYPAVAPSLKRSGIRIDLVDGQKHNWKTVLTASGIDAARLKEHGFALYKNFQPLEPLDGDAWGSVRGDNKIQMIHRDHPRNNGVAYFYAPKDTFTKRLSYTVLGDAGDVFEGIKTFIKARGLHPEAGNVLNELIQALQSGSNLTFDAVSPEARYTWGRYFFSNAGTSLHGMTPQELLELYNYLSSITYRHAWEAGDLLLLAEDTMVHGRLPYALDQVPTESKLTVRALSIKPDGKLTKL